MSKNVKILKSFTERNSSTGENKSYTIGDVVAGVSDEVASAWASSGFAEEYTLITPTGKKEITANGDNIDVTAYASVKVNVAG